MSAIKHECIYVDVTRGDCVEANRKGGKSNTGTYFISSINNFEDFSYYFSEDNLFKVDLKKVQIYKILFCNLFYWIRDEYNGKMNQFEEFCNYLLSLDDNPIVDISLRKNDTRVFMRFLDNVNNIVNCFRHLLYEDLSFICIEKREDVFYVYPVINENLVEINNCDSNFILDED